MRAPWWCGPREHFVWPCTLGSGEVGDINAHSDEAAVSFVRGLIADRRTAANSVLRTPLLPSPRLAAASLCDVTIIPPDFLCCWGGRGELPPRTPRISALTARLAGTKAPFLTERWNHLQGLSKPDSRAFQVSC